MVLVMFLDGMLKKNESPGIITIRIRPTTSRERRTIEQRNQTSAHRVKKTKPTDQLLLSH